MKKGVGLFLLAILFVVALFSLQRSSRFYRYELIDLGEVANPRNTGICLNDRGDIFYYSILKGETVQGFFREPDGATKPFEEVFGQTPVQLTDINNAGRVCGYVIGATATHRAFVWDTTSGFQFVETPPDSHAYIHDINESGELAGAVSSGTDKMKPHFWKSATADGLPLDASRGWNGYGRRINEMGTVIGGQFNVDNPLNPMTAAFVWSPTEGIVTPEKLDQLGVALLAINDRGDLFGQFGPLGDSFVWTRSSGVEKIPPIGKAILVPWDLNNRGQAIGVYNESNPSGLRDLLLRILSLPWIDRFTGPIVNWLDATGNGGFLYEEGETIPLEDQVGGASKWDVLSPMRINDPGQIVGIGLKRGVHHFFLLEPVHK
ncbi:MAG: hypothetical protein KC944_10525 [Candidatus Omnitrophica bacterium]|nr:hypothetical protein [Candidatus Omnitrophota bacterium]